MVSVQEVLKKLEAKARPDQLEGMARFGIAVDRRLGVSVPDMRQIAKELGKDHELAIELWKTSIPEARIVAARTQGAAAGEQRAAADAPGTATS